MSRRLVEEFTRIVDSDEDGLYRYSDMPGIVARHQAAVLMPFFRHAGEWQVLFIRRAHNERDSHGGQVAFPGGRMEAGDNTAADTALRETEEEIGLPAAAVTLLGELPGYTTISGYRVTPIAGLIETWPQPLVLQESEVDCTLTIPLDWLSDRRNVSLRARPEHDEATAKRHPVVVFEPYRGDILWGATARMMLHGLKALREGRLALPAQ